jgi:hypothetical protein
MTPMRSSLLALALGLVAAAAGAVPSLMFDGKIVAVDKEKLVLSAGAEQPEFVLAKSTKITLNGKPATVVDLMSGQTAKIAAEREETKLRAIEVAAFSPK